MSKQNKYSSIALVLMIMASTSIVQSRADVDNVLLFTETSPTSITVTLDGTALRTITVTDNKAAFVYYGYVTPFSTYGAYWQTWERTDGTFIDLSVGREAPHDTMPFEISLGDLVPTVPPYVGYLNAPNPIVPDGTIVSTLPSTIILGDSTPITEIGFIDLTDTGTGRIPDNTSTWILWIISGLALYGSKRLGLNRYC